MKVSDRKKPRDEYCYAEAIKGVHYWKIAGAANNNPRWQGLTKLTRETAADAAMRHAKSNGLPLPPVRKRSKANRADTG